MAKRTVNIGSASNDGTGDPLRSAFDKLNKNFDEVYGDNFVTNAMLNDNVVDSAEIAAGAVDEEHLNATNSPTDNYILSYDSGSGGFTWVQQFDGDITGIVAGAGLTGTSLDTDDATLNVIGGDGITVNADEVEVTVDDSTIELSASDGTGSIRVKNDGIDHDQLAARYTESGTLTDGSAITVDASAKNIYTHTITQATTFNFTNAAIGQVLTMVITGDASNGITLGTINTNSATFNKISGDFDEANAVKNLIEIKFISTSEAWYQISQVAS